MAISSFINLYYNLTKDDTDVMNRYDALQEQFYIYSDLNKS